MTVYALFGICPLKGGYLILVVPFLLVAEGAKATWFIVLVFAVGVPTPVLVLFCSEP